jgi:hypothetical protein
MRYLWSIERMTWDVASMLSGSLDECVGTTWTDCWGEEIASGRPSTRIRDA